MQFLGTFLGLFWEKLLQFSKNFPKDPKKYHNQNFIPKKIRRAYLSLYYKSAPRGFGSPSWLRHASASESYNINVRVSSIVFCYLTLVFLRSFFTFHIGLSYFLKAAYVASVRLISAPCLARADKSL